MRAKTAGGLARGTALSAAVIALATVVTGCKGAVVVSAPGTTSASSASSTSSAPSVSSAAPAAATSQASAAQASGPGTLSVSVTSPVSLSGTSQAAVSCAAGIGYHAQATSAVIDGDQVTYSAAIARYRGPGTYPAVVAVTLRQSTGVVTTIAGVSEVPAVITAGGGSFSVSATGTGGRTFTGSLNWTCGS